MLSATKIAKESMEREVYRIGCVSYLNKYCIANVHVLYIQDNIITRSELLEFLQKGYWLQADDVVTSPSRIKCIEECIDDSGKLTLSSMELSAYYHKLSFLFADLLKI